MCMIIIHTQWFYTLRHNIKWSVAILRAMPTPFYLSIKTFVPQVYMGFSNSLTPENIISKYS